MAILKRKKMVNWAIRRKKSDCTIIKILKNNKNWKKKGKRKKTKIKAEKRSKSENLVG